MRIVTIMVSGLLILALAGCTVQGGDDPEPAQSAEVKTQVAPGRAALEQRITDLEARLNRMEMLLIEVEREIADIGLQASKALNQSLGRQSLFDLSGDEKFEEKVLRQGMVLLRELLDEMEQKALQDIQGEPAPAPEAAPEPAPAPEPESAPETVEP